MCEVVEADGVGFRVVAGHGGSWRGLSSWLGGVQMRRRFGHVLVVVLASALQAVRVSVDIAPIVAKVVRTSPALL